MWARCYEKEDAHVHQTKFLQHVRVKRTRHIYIYIYIKDGVVGGPYVSLRHRPHSLHRSPSALHFKTCTQLGLHTIPFLPFPFLCFALPPPHYQLQARPTSLTFLFVCFLLLTKTWQAPFPHILLTLRGPPTNFYLEK
jgi:hypothetical protein